MNVEKWMNKLSKNQIIKVLREFDHVDEILDVTVRLPTFKEKLNGFKFDRLIVKFKYKNELYSTNISGHTSGLHH